MGKIGETLVVVALAIVGVAILAVLVSGRSNTVAVIDSLSRGFSGSLGAALSPVVSPQSL